MVFCVSLSQPIMSVPTFMSVPTYYVCPRFMSVPTFFVCPNLLFCVSLSPAIIATLGSILDSQLSKIEPRSAHIMQLRPPTHPGHQLEIGSLFCVSLSVPTFMSVFTNYVCPLLLCLSPPFLSVPTFYVCPHLLCLSTPFMSVPSFYVCPHLLCLSPPIMSVPTNHVCPHPSFFLVTSPS